MWKEYMPEKRGQPKKSRKLTNAAKRAFVLQQVSIRLRKLYNMDEHAPLELSTPLLIKEALSIYPDPKYVKLFSKPSYTHRMYEELKKGRKILSLDNNYLEIKQ